MPQNLVAYSPGLGRNGEPTLEVGESPGYWRVSLPAGGGEGRRGWGLAVRAVQAGNGHPGDF